MIYYCLLKELKIVQPIEAEKPEEALEEILLRYNAKAEVLKRNKFEYKNFEDWHIAKKIK